MAGDKRYVYGVIDAEPLELQVEGVGGADRVYTVEHRDHAAVVSDVGTLEPERTEENVRAHDAVLRTVMEHDGGRTVVPMRFGMVFENERALKHVLQRTRPALRESLDRLADTVELGVKVIADDGAAVDGDAVRSALESELDPLSVSVSTGEPFSDRLVANRSYLVERSDRPAFDDAVGRLRESLDGVTVQYTGPWAPYSFVDIEVGVAP